jgi:hypothetical protein
MQCKWPMNYYWNNLLCPHHFMLRAPHAFSSLSQVFSFFRSFFCSLAHQFSGMCSLMLSSMTLTSYMPLQTSRHSFCPWLSQNSLTSDAFSSFHLLDHSHYLMNILDLINSCLTHVLLPYCYLDYLADNSCYDSCRNLWWLILSKS